MFSLFTINLARECIWLVYQRTNNCSFDLLVLFVFFCITFCHYLYHFIPPILGHLLGFYPLWLLIWMLNSLTLSLHLSLYIFLQVSALCALTSFEINWIFIIIPLQIFSDFTHELWRSVSPFHVYGFLIVIPLLLISLYLCQNFTILLKFVEINFMSSMQSFS